MLEKVCPPLSILVIDDETRNQELLASKLREVPGWALKIESAKTAAEAQERMKGPPYDLIFLDNRLPDHLGIELLDRIRQFHPKSAVVMITASGNEQLAVSAMKKGAMDYLSHEVLWRMDFNQLLRRVIEMRYLVDQNMELRQVNQMKTEFIANVSHELRTPLSVIIGYAQTLKTGSLGAVTATQVKALESILTRADDLLKTLNHILRVREGHEGKQQLILKPLDLSAFLTERGKPNKEMQRKGMRLETQLPQPDVWVKADESRLAEVLENLLSNAAKFGPAGSVVRLGLRAQDGQAVMTVKDEGPGIAPEMLPRVFEQFSAAVQGPTREYNGLGLSLPLAREVVERHSGRIWLESNSGRGTTAVVSLPLSDRSAAGQAIEAPVQVQKQRILIVEDNPDIIDIMLLFLGTISRNLQVVTARSGYEALDEIKNQPPHLVILDIMMPGMDGFEVIARLRRAPETARIPIMVLTGYSEAVTRAKQAGADEVMLKPFEKKSFVDRLMILLKRGAQPTSGSPAPTSTRG